ARDLRNLALVNAYSQTLSVKLKLNDLETQKAFLWLNVAFTSMGLWMRDTGVASRGFIEKQGDRFNRVTSLYEEAIVAAPDDPDINEWRERLNALKVWRSLILSGEEGLRKHGIV